MGHPVDKMFGGLFLTSLITLAILMVLPALPVPALNGTLGIRQLLIGMSIAVGIVFPRPVLLRTLLRARRSPFLLDQDIDSMLIGRVMGLVFGVIASLWLFNLLQ
ncbi:hypothetical protein [Paraburkholderia fungorum]|uniref:hypothetical protein n=1 Tax=Paraburkholderia fungorum TaxID=134537 RepID=UPI0038BBCD21